MKVPFTLRIGLRSIVFGIAAGLVTQTTFAAFTIEEIVVTARKKQEDLQQVPVTIAVIDTESLQRLNINDVKDVAELIPTFQTAQRGSGAGASMYLRGIGSNSNDAAFDSAIAFNFDGVVANSSRLIAQGNLDMGQVEVLKGPQSLYFGKGASAGVVSIKSANPSEQTEAYIKAAYEVEDDGTTVEGVISGALSDSLLGRLAVRNINIDEIAKNTFPGVANPSRGEQSTDARLTLIWNPAENFSANFKYSVSDYENDGSLSFTDINCAGASAQASIYPQSSALVVPGGFQIPNNYDCKFGDQQIQIADQNSIVNQAGGHPGNNNGVPYGKQDLDLARLKMDWFINDALTLTSVTSSLDLAEAGFDCFAYDSNGSNCVSTENTVDSFSQELRLLGNLSDNVSFLLGGYYQDRDVVHVNSQDALSIPVLLSIITGSPLAAVDPLTGYTIDWIKRHPTAHKTKSIFASLSWDINDQWNLTAGGRYSDEQKNNFYTTPFVHAGFAALLPGGSAPSGFSVPINFDDSNFSPEVSLQYVANPNTNYFIAYKTGFKSGGVSYSQLPFLADYFALLAGDTSALVFQSETADGFEAGIKSYLLEGNLRFNATAYSYTFEDLQNQQFNSSTFVFTTFNAGKVDNQGLEADFIYKTDTDGLSIRGVIAYTDTKYSAEFKNIAGVDLNGLTRQNAPKISFNAGFDYVKPLNNGLRAYLGATLYYSDDYNTTTSQQATPNDYVQDSYTRGDLVASLGAQDDSWTVALIGRNISDEIVTVDTVGRPGSAPNALGQQDQAHFINRGRQLFLEATYRF